jgi:hypothetical protein
MSINRFYDLNLNPQKNIFYNWAVNSQLEATDNYDNPYPYFFTMDESLPVSITTDEMRENMAMIDNENKKACPSGQGVKVYNRYTDSFMN